MGRVAAQRRSYFWIPRKNIFTAAQGPQIHKVHQARIVRSFSRLATHIGQLKIFTEDSVVQLCTLNIYLLPK